MPAEIQATPRNVWFQAGPVWGGFVVALSLCWFMATTLTRIEDKIGYTDEKRLEDRRWIEREFMEVKQRLTSLEEAK